MRAASSRFWVATTAATPELRISLKSCSNTRSAVRRIEIAGRLISEEHLGLVGDGTGNRDALLLAARELRRAMVPALLEAERLQKLPRPLLGLLPASSRG